MTGQGVARTELGSETNVSSARRTPRERTRMDLVFMRFFLGFGFWGFGVWDLSPGDGSFSSRAKGKRGRIFSPRKRPPGVSGRASSWAVFGRWADAAGNSLSAPSVVGVVLVARGHAGIDEAALIGERSDVHGAAIGDGKQRAVGTTVRAHTRVGADVAGVRVVGRVDCFGIEDRGRGRAIGFQLEIEIGPAAVIQATLRFVARATNFCQERRGERRKDEQREEDADGTDNYGFCIHGVLSRFWGSFQGDGSRGACTIEISFRCFGGGGCSHGAEASY